MMYINLKCIFNTCRISLFYTHTHTMEDHTRNAFTDETKDINLIEFMKFVNKKNNKSEDPERQKKKEAIKKLIIEEINTYILPLSEIVAGWCIDDVRNSDLYYHSKALVNYIQYAHMINEGIKDLDDYDNDDRLLCYRDPPEKPGFWTITYHLRELADDNGITRIKMHEILNTFYDSVEKKYSLNANKHKFK